MAYKWGLLTTYKSWDPWASPYRAQEQGGGDGSMEATILTDGTHPMPETTGRAPIPPVRRSLVGPTGSNTYISLV